MSILADALTHHAGEFVEFARPDGGFYLWVNLVDPDGEHVRIAFPLTPVDELEEGARRIAVACKRVKQGKSAQGESP